MGFFSKVASSLKMGAFLAGCQNACIRHGSEPDSAELFVGTGKDILLNCYKDGHDPETAVGILSFVILNIEEGMPMNMLGGAHRYATSYIRRYPDSALTSRLEGVIRERQSQSKGDQQPRVQSKEKCDPHAAKSLKSNVAPVIDSQQQAKDRGVHSQALERGFQEAAPSVDSQEELRKKDTHAQSLRGGLDSIYRQGMSSEEQESQQRMQSEKDYYRVLKEERDLRSQQGLPMRSFNITKTGNLRMLKPKQSQTSAQETEKFPWQTPPYYSTFGEGVPAEIGKFVSLTGQDEKLDQMLWEQIKKGESVKDWHSFVAPLYAPYRISDDERNTAPLTPQARTAEERKAAEESLHELRVRMARVLGSDAYPDDSN